VNETTIFLLRWLISGVAVLLTSKIVRNFEVNGFVSALFAALIIGLANAIVWPVLIFLTLPINVVTLGLFTFVVNGMVIKIAALFVPGFVVKTWWAAIFGSIVLSLVSILLHYVLNI
jgi:putative membrane protein